MSGFLHDLRFSLRQLVKRPGFAAAAIITLALGIGANTAVFSVLNGYLLKPLPYPKSDQLVTVDFSFRNAGMKDVRMSVPGYYTIRKHVSAFSNSALFDVLDLSLQAHGRAKLIVGAYVTPSLFGVLRIKPFAGRTFQSNAIQPGRGQEAMLSYSLWQSQFGGNLHVIGKEIRIRDKAYRVIGIMPKHFAFPNRNVNVWLPMPITPADRAEKHLFDTGDQMIARLRPHTRLTAADRELYSLLIALAKTHSPKAQQDVRSGAVALSTRPYHRVLVGDRMGTLLLLQGAVLLVLLITCVNVANLLLSRILGRTRELAIRAAVGATRFILARQLLVEGLCLALPGGIIGIALGWLSLQFFSSSAIGPGQSLFSISPDWHVAGFAILLVGLTGLVVSLLPLWHLGRTDLHSLLQEGGQAVAGGRKARRIRQVLVVIELGMATVLLAGTGLLLHSLLRLQAVNPGYTLNHVLLTEMVVPPNDHASPGGLANFYRDLQNRIATLPGVRSVGMTNVPPFQTGTLPPIFKFEA
jgi:putative ABC transport system permease protein